MLVPTTPDQAATPRAAATILLLREGRDPGQAEVLMLHRHAGAGFAASAWVFPGGMVDAGDAEVDGDHWRGIDPEALAERFDLAPRDVLARHVAAVRETFEEAGVLLATHRDGRPADLADPAWVQLRRDLNDRTVTVDLAAFLREHDVVLDLGAVTYWQRWITPIQEPRRYDTSFFVARVPDGADPTPDDIEMTEARWVTAHEALEDTDFPIIFPTRRTLELMTAVGGVEAVLDHARRQERVISQQPHVLMDADGNPTAVVLPDDERFPHELYR